MLLLGKFLGHEEDLLSLMVWLSACNHNASIQCEIYMSVLLHMN